MSEAAESQTQYPAYVVPPEEIGAVVGGELFTPRREQASQLLAPGLCTSLGLTDVEEAINYRLVTAEGHVTAHFTAHFTVYRFPDESAASRRTREV